ncbi:hypothetical protein [Cohnella zeiphila]|uniref:NADH:flavin oxidoreductase/NADH oxidase N-terminal domain-containing protein n=1 Tax=Cohnella zeiphila TaxID=2761120 RepID=A0A7X0VVJ2_9BACL|nr:hypothetical protein [Cohnella zeiphila]MBB6731407.1 hypothetical protein [Cohnella zeiphila]
MTKSRIVMIQERVGNRIPVVGVGGLLTPEDVVKALETGVPLVALGHALMMNPDWPFGPKRARKGIKNRHFSLLSKGIGDSRQSMGGYSE